MPAYGGFEVELNKIGIHTIDSSDMYILKMYLPLSEVGLYNIGYQAAMLSNILVMGFVNAWPNFYHKNNQDNNGQLLTNYGLASIMIPGSLLVILVSIFSPFFFKLFLPDKFFHAYTIIPVVASAYLLKGPIIILLMGLYVKNKNELQLYVQAGVALFNIIGNIILIPVLGRFGAAITTFISYVLCLCTFNFLVRRINPIPNLLLNNFILSMVLIMIFGYGILIFNPDQMPLMTMFIVFSLLIISPFYYKKIKELAVMPFQANMVS